MPKWLKCVISKGMFSDEFTVLVKTRSGDLVSVFVPKDAARTEHGETGRVRVRVAQEAGRTIAVLPDEHQSVIDVESSELAAA